MRLILTIARHDLKMVLQDRSAVMWMFVLPVVFITFFGLVMGGGDQAGPVDAKVRLTVVDYDGEFLARALIEDLASERLELVELSPVEAETAEDTIRTLVIPAGFTESVVGGQKVDLRLEKEPGTNQEAALVAQARIISSVARLTGRLIEAATEEGAEADENSFAETGGERDLVTVESRFAGRARTAPSGFAQSIPGNTVLFVMLVALTYGAASITAERQGGQLKRLATTPVSRRQIILGKLVGRLVVAALQITVLMLVAVLANRFLGVSIGDHAAAAYVILLVYAVCVAPLGLMMGAWFKDPDRAANVGVLVTMVMGALGGTMWPLEFVSPTMQRVALVFPTGWAMKALHQVISFGRNLSEVAPEIGVLIVFAAAFSAIASRSLRIE
jgi:ABC-type multidrug transport system permease subunit